MKKFSRYALLLFALAFCTQTCSKGPSPSKNEEIHQLGSAKRLEAFAGRNRVKLSFVMDDEQISHCEVFWNDKQQSRKINKSEAIKDTIRTVIDNLLEGSHSFEVVTYDRQGKPANSSVKVTASVYRSEEHTSELQSLMRIS